jgi:hypothetical protein
MHPLYDLRRGRRHRDLRRLGYGPFWLMLLPGNRRTRQGVVDASRPTVPIGGARVDSTKDVG